VGRKTLTQSITETFNAIFNAPFLFIFHLDCESKKPCHKVIFTTSYIKHELILVFRLLLMLTDLYGRWLRVRKRRKRKERIRMLQISSR